MKHPIIATIIAYSSFAAAFATSAVACDDEFWVDVDLNRALVTRGVEDREPLDAEGPFEADGERLYIFLDVDNRWEPNVDLVVRWTHEESELAFTQTINVGQSRRWRTWVYHRMSPARAGHWNVAVSLSEDFGGDPLTSLDFEVVPAQPREPTEAISGPTS
jgi:hypothetical protein